MTNNEMIRAYVNGTMTRGAVNHIGFKDGTFINYATILCEIDRENMLAHFNSRKYSTTTSKIQSRLRSELTEAGFEISEYDGEPCYIWNYGYQGAQNVTMADVRKYL